MSRTIRALITGASGDLGAAIARKLATDGFAVILHANSNLTKVEKLAAELQQQGFSAQAVQFNITDAAEVTSKLEQLLEEGAIQVIVNNAGIYDDAPMAGMSQQQWQQVLDVSLNGFFNVTQPLLLPMIRTRWGRVINISSVAGITGNRGQTNYAAAKAGLIGASKSLALELASRKITVNVVAPGVIAGEMTSEVFSDDLIKQLVPMQQAGEPEDVANAVSFLASEQARYITSQVINVNGGMI